MKKDLVIIVVGAMCFGTSLSLAEDEVPKGATEKAKEALKRACEDIDLHHMVEEDVSYVPEEGEDSVDLNPSQIQPPQEIRVPLRLKLEPFLPGVNLDVAELPETGELGTLTVDREGKEIKYNGRTLKALPSRQLKELCGKVKHLWSKK